MERKALVEKLEIVSPALSESDQVPVLSHFWLTGEELTTFNGQVAISVPLKTEVKGAVEKKLLTILKLSQAKDVTMDLKASKEGPDVFYAKAASSDIYLAILPPEDFIFAFPEKQGTVLPIKNADDLVAGIEACMRSVGNDSSMPDQMGITLVPEGDDMLVAYATNNQTMSRADIPLIKGKASIKRRVILPTLFCQQLLKLGKKVKDIQIEIGDDFALFTAGKVTVLGMLVATEMPFDFQEIFDHHFTEAVEKAMVPIPTKLHGVIDRAVGMTDGMRERGLTSVSCKAGNMKFVSRVSNNSEILDTVQLPEHPTVSTAIDPKLLEDIHLFERFVVTAECAIMTKGPYVYLVTASGS